MFKSTSYTRQHTGRATALKLGAWCWLLMAVAGCSRPSGGIFTKKTPCERYIAALRSAGLENTGLYRQWKAASDGSLRAPLGIVVPYQEAGFFSSEHPDAAGYTFLARKGEKLSFTVDRQPSNVLLFCEVWTMTDSVPRLLYAADTSEGNWNIVIEASGSYLLRVQPELLESVNYSVDIRSMPSLSFPVGSSYHPVIRSFWGASREGGLRRHEGIDIFAARGTPALAAAPGTIARVGQNRLGGNVISLRPDNARFSLYYAHLDSQLVQEGQRVTTGDIIGLIGNTGNAGTTPPHLHFGIYERLGAVDPLPFVARDRPEPPEVSGDSSMLAQHMRTTAATGLHSSLVPKAAARPLKKNTAVTVVAAADTWYRVLLPDSSKGFIAVKKLTISPIGKRFSPGAQLLYDRPFEGSPIKAVMEEGTVFTIDGQWEHYWRVHYDSLYGWVLMDNVSSR